MGRTNTAGYSDDDIEEMKLKDGIKLHERRKSIVYKYCIDNQLEQVKPIVLIACKSMPIISSTLLQRMQRIWE